MKTGGLWTKFICIYDLVITPFLFFHLPSYPSISHDCHWQFLRLFLLAFIFISLNAMLQLNLTGDIFIHETIFLS